MAPRSSAVFPLGLANGSTRVHAICLRRPFESIAVSVISARAMRSSALTVFSKFKDIVLGDFLSGMVIVNDPVASTCVIVPSSVGVSVSFLCWMIIFLLSKLLLLMLSMVGGSSFWEVIPIDSSCFEVILQLSSLAAAMAVRR